MCENAALALVTVLRRICFVASSISGSDAPGVTAEDEDCMEASRLMSETRPLPVENGEQDDNAARGTDHGARQKEDHGWQHYHGSGGCLVTFRRSGSHCSRGRFSGGSHHPTGCDIGHGLPAVPR